MTTRRKCQELAEQHGLTIEYSFQGWSKSCHINLPKGWVIEDDGGERKGITFEDYPVSAADFWAWVYKDLTTLISQKPWHKL